MKCPYCGRRVNDMPDHLESDRGFHCRQAHEQKLRIELREAMRAFAKRTGPAKATEDPPCRNRYE